MNLDDISKQTGITFEDLVDYGIDDESTIMTLSDSFKDLLLMAKRDCESLIHPDMIISDMIEHSLLMESDKENLFIIFMNVNNLLREYQAAKFSGKNATIEWIKQFHNYWKENKKTLIELNKKLSQGWKSKAVIDLKKEYFG